MNVKQLKEIVMNLDDNWQVVMEEQSEKIDTIKIKTVEISLETEEVIFKTW